MARQGWWFSFFLVCFLLSSYLFASYLLTINFMIPIWCLVSNCLVFFFKTLRYDKYCYLSHCVDNDFLPLNCNVMDIGVCCTI